MVRKIKEGAPFPLVKGRVHENVIKDTEFITDMYSSTLSYYQQQLRVAAFVSTTFLTLAALVAPYEYYRFDYLNFYAEPVTNDLFTGTELQTGYWGLGFVSDPLLTDGFQNKQEFMMTEGAVHSKSTSPLYLKCDMSRVRHVMDKYLYCSRAGTNNQDIRMTDYGILFMVSGQQMASGYMLGSLYSEYKVSVRKLIPQVGLPISQVPFCTYLFTNYGQLPPIAPCGTLQVPFGQNNVSLTFTPIIDSIIAVNTQVQCIIFPDTLVGDFQITFLITANNAGVWSWGNWTQFSPAITYSQNYAVNLADLWIAPSGSAPQSLTLYVNIPAGAYYEQSGNLQNANYMEIDVTNMEIISGALNGFFYMMPIPPGSF